MNNKVKIGCILIVVVSPIILGLLFIYKTKDTITINVTKTERISIGSGENLIHKYLVFTENETFENTDTIFYLKFNSSDIQGKLKPDTTYQIQVYGWRIPLLSQYRNIIKVE